MVPPRARGPHLTDAVLQRLGIDTTRREGTRSKSHVQSRKQLRKELRKSGRAEQKGPIRNNTTQLKRPHFNHNRSVGGENLRDTKKHSSIGTSTFQAPENDDQDAESTDSGSEESYESTHDKFSTHADEYQDDDVFGGFGSSDDERGEAVLSDDGASGEPDSRSGVSKQVREALEHDDAEIARLERKLGIKKGRKTLPKSFDEDGLGDLVEPLENETQRETNADHTTTDTKRKAEDEEWLRMKRRKALSSAASANGDEGEQPVQRRENPYTAPVQTLPTRKYVPPALRKAQEERPDPDSEVLSTLRKQANQLIARISDSNMLSIVNEVDKMYQSQPRRHVTDAVVDKLLEQVLVDGALTSSVIMVLAGFGTALYYMQGPTFGGLLVEKSATLFQQHYDEAVARTEEQLKSVERGQSSALSWAPSSKTPRNILALMTELYNFGMIGPNLIYDYIRRLFGSLTELNTELLLHVVEASGHRLRQDDPRAIKEIVLLLQNAVAQAGGEQKLSARTRHMISRISELKRSEKKKRRDPGNSGFSHVEKIKQALSSLRTSKKLETTTPLHISLADVEGAERLGKWWLVGAPWAGRTTVTADDSDEPTRGEAHAAGKRGDVQRGRGEAKDEATEILGSWAELFPDPDELEKSARAVGLRNSVQRSIFVTLFQAADQTDAVDRLTKLGLNKKQKREVAAVLIRSVGSEEGPTTRFMPIVARQVCLKDARMDRVFKFGLWKLFRQMGEPIFGEMPDDDEADGDGAVDVSDMRRLVNIAKMYGYLIASGCLGIDVLKCVDLVHMDGTPLVFVQVMILSLFEESRRGAKDGKVIVRNRFRAARGSEPLRKGILHCIEVVRESSLVTDGEVKRVAKACGWARDALESEDGQKDRDHNP